MMRPSPDLVGVYVYTGIVDFRKGINGLSVLVQAELELDPFSERLFVFRNRRQDAVKILYWERSGFCMWQKRLEKESFRWPKFGDSAVAIISGEQLNWLLDGYDINAMNPHETLKYSSII
jgi:transposase